MEILFKDHKGRSIKVEQLEEKCWGTISEGTAYFFTPVIGSEKESHRFYELSKKLDESRRKSPKASSFPLRMSACQLSSPVTEWESIADQRLWLTKLVIEEGMSAQSAHLLLPTEPIFYPKDELPPSEFLLRDLDKLTKYFNIAAYEMYCYWLAEEIELILEKFPLQRVDLYTLEAHFKDFIHEVRVSLIRHSESNFQENILAEGALQGKIQLTNEEKRSSPEIERAIFRTFAEGMRRLHVQNQTLIEMYKVISSIEKAHPELVHLKRQALVLSQLLTSALDLDGDFPSSWGRTFLLVQILNRLMGVVSGINANGFMERAHMGLAVCLALTDAEGDSTPDSLIDLAVRWDAPEATEKEPQKQLRKEIWRAIKEVAVPLAEAKGHPDGWLETQAVNSDWVLLIPSAALAEGKALLSRLV